MPADIAPRIWPLSQIPALSTKKLKKPKRKYNILLKSRHQLSGSPVHPVESLANRWSRKDGLEESMSPLGPEPEKQMLEDLGRKFQHPHHPTVSHCLQKGQIILSRIQVLYIMTPIDLVSFSARPSNPYPSWSICAPQIYPAHPTCRSLFQLLKHDWS